MGTLLNEPIQLLLFSASSIAHFGRTKKLSTQLFLVPNPQIWRRKCLCQGANTLFSTAPNARSEAFCASVSPFTPLILSRS